MIKQFEVCDRCLEETPTISQEDADFLRGEIFHEWTSRRGKPSSFHLCIRCEKALGEFIRHP